jgi:predicted aspartyl protease
MMMLRSLRSVMLFSVAVTCVAGGPTAAEDAAAIQTLPTRLDPSTEQLLIGVDTAGARFFWCSVDTGFSALVAIDRTKAQRAGIVEVPAKPTPDGRRPFGGDGSATVTLQVGPITLRDQPVIVRDVGPDVEDMDCVIGAALLRTHVIEFDYEAARVRLHPAVGFASPPGASSVPLIFRTNPSVPFVSVHVDFPDGNGRDLQTVVDTGASYYALAVAPPASTWMRERSVTATRPEHPETASGTLQLVATRPRGLTLGPFHVTEPVIALVSTELGGVDDGLLGVGFLRRFTVWIDFNGRALYLRPNRNIEAPHLFDASGLGFKRTADGYAVEVILPGTPAASADIRVGDRLVTIDGQHATELGSAALRERLSRSGSRCELVLQREENRRAVTLTLASRL